MPDWLHYLLSWWTTPFTILAGVVGAAALVGLRGRRLAAIAAATSLTLAMVAAWKSGPPSGLLDLTIYMGSARGWMDGGSLYDFRDQVFNLGATYPPIGPLLFVPFAPLSDEGREVVFTFLSMAALGGAAWCTAGLAGLCGRRRVDWALWGFAAAVVTTPVWLTVRQGQINVVLWFLVLVDVAALQRRRPWSGIPIGLATAIKLTPGLFIVWLATTRRWTATIRAVVAVVAVTTIGCLLAIDDSRRYWTELLWDTGRVGDVGDDRNNSVLGAIARVLGDSPARTVLWIFIVGVIVGVALVRATRASRAGDLLAATAIVGCAAAAASPISWSHHLGWLLIALVPFVVGARSTRDRGLCALAYLALVGPMGHGDEAWLSSARAVLCCAAVLFVPIRTHTVEPTEPTEPDRVPAA